VISFPLLLAALGAADASPGAAPPIASIHERGPEAVAAAITENHRRLRESHRARHRALGGPAPGSSPAGDAAQEEYDVLHYAIDLTIDPDDPGQYLAGHADILLEATDPPLDQVVLDLDNLLTVSGVLRQGVGAQSFEHLGDALSIDLDPPLDAGEGAGLRVLYAGSPYVFDWDAFDIDYSRPTPVVWTTCEPEGSRKWWPCKDRPDDKATVEVVITLPDNYVVASNGLLQSIVDNGDGSATTTWATDYLLPPYLVAITATDFLLFEDSYDLIEGGELPLTYYTYPESEAAAREDVSGVPDMLGVFENDWLPYPFAAEKYGQMEYPWGGAMEHTTLTSYGTALYTGDHYYDWIVAHELAHQWWGDMVTCGTWDDIWLNEGFATYGEAIWTEGIYGEQAYLSYMQAIKEPWFPGPIYDPYYLFNNTVYDKGAWVLHMLRGIVGRDTLMAILQTWGTRYAHQAALTSQFTDVASEVAGQDLDWFFDPWLYESGRVEYEYARQLTDLDGDSTLVELALAQVQPGHSPYRMPITLRLERAQGTDLDTLIINDAPSQSYSFRVAGHVIDIDPDPEGYILALFRDVPWTGIEGDAPGVPGSGPRLGNPTPNPFNPRTTIPVEIERAAQVRLRIFDLGGRIVRTLHDGELPAGASRLVWDGRSEKGIALPSGVYLVRLEAVGAAPRSRRLVLLK